VDLSNSEECGFLRKPIPVDGTAKRDFKASFSGSSLLRGEGEVRKKAPTIFFPTCAPSPKREGKEQEITEETE